jgi:prolyl-tRNA synthetase
MFLSKMGFEPNKLANLDEMFPAQDLLLQTGQLVQYASGIFGFGNVPVRVMQNVEKIIRDVLDEFGCVEVSLPILQPESLWRETGRWDGYIRDGTMLTVKTEKGNYAIAPTAEEAIVAFVRNRIKSYKSLPVTLYQIGAKFRNEIRNRGYLLRGKNFNMMDAYSFVTTEKEMDDVYKNLRKAYLEIFKRIGLPVVPVAADSGAIGGDNSEEFMFISPAGEDTIYVDKKSGKAFNAEVLEKYGIKDLKSYDERRSIELGHIFQLGPKYSTAMDAKFVTDQGKPEIFYMDTFGIGVSRLVAVIYEDSVIKGKDGQIAGVSLPTSVAPYRVQIIATPNRTDAARKLYGELCAAGVTCILDDRETATFGAKIADAKKLGTPYLAILGDKTADGEIEIEATKSNKKFTAGGADEIQQKCI